MPAVARVSGSMEVSGSGIGEKRVRIDDASEDRVAVPRIDDSEPPLPTESMDDDVGGGGPQSDSQVGQVLCATMKMIGSGYPLAVMDTSSFVVLGNVMHQSARGQHPSEMRCSEILASII